MLRAGRCLSSTSLSCTVWTAQWPPRTSPPSSWGSFRPASRLRWPNTSNRGVSSSSRLGRCGQEIFSRDELSSLNTFSPQGGLMFHQGRPCGADLKYIGPGNQRRGRADQFSKVRAVVLSCIVRELTPSASVDHVSVLRKAASHYDGNADSGG